jgi:hypothetical protein
MSELDPRQFDLRRWLEPFDGSGIEWHESLPLPYTYRASDFNKLVAAVHEYEAALAQERQRADVLERFLRELGYDENDFDEWLSAAQPTSEQP